MKVSHTLWEKWVGLTQSTDNTTKLWLEPEDCQVQSPTCKTIPPMQTLCLKQGMKHRETLPFLEDSESIICYYPTGSRCICYPPPENTDEDYIVLVNSIKYVTYPMILSMLGWKENGKQYKGSDFISFKKDIDGVLTNLIITKYDDFYQQWIHATEDAKERNLLNKADRIKLFDDYINYRI